MRAFGALLLVLVCAGCDRAPVPASAPDHAKAAVDLPQDQTSLIGLIRGVKADASTFDHFCSAFQQMKTFDNWGADVADVQISTVNNSIDITFDAGHHGQPSGADHVRLETVVQKGDALYPAVEALTVGDAVRLSGRFPHSNGADECGYYRGTFTVNLTGVHKG